MDLGHEMQARFVSIEEVHAVLRQGPGSLGHIQENSVLVVDHLGANIPVSTLFCSTWQVGNLYFVYILSAH